LLSDSASVKDKCKQILCRDYDPQQLGMVAFLEQTTSAVFNQRFFLRQGKDNKDILILIEFLKERSPFTADQSLRNIETGMVANDDANADRA
jgi:hypothetical protein